MRQLVLSPRWIVWHLLTLGAMVTCGWLAAWQWSRAGSAMGSALNVGYGLQWPVFAVFFGVMWWRMLRMEAAALQASQEADTTPDAPLPAPAETAAPPAAAESPDARSADGGSSGTEGGTSGPSPFGPRPASVVVVDDADDPELAAYNRMLARLAARDSDH